MGRLDANKLIKDAAGEGSEGHEEHGGESLYHVREHLNHRKGSVDRNSNCKGLLVRAQKDTRNVVLQTGGKTSLSRSGRKLS